MAREQPGSSASVWRSGEFHDDLSASGAEHFNADTHWIGVN